MATLGELIVKIGADARGLANELNNSTKQLSKWSKQAEKGIGPVMEGIGRGIMVVGTAAATGFAALIVGSVRGASSLEQYRNTLNVVMKDQEKAAQTMAWAVDFANKTPFETNSIVEATVRLSAYGLEAQKVLPAIGDMAAVMNKDIMQAVEAVADAQTGELERLKEFGITKTMIIEHGNKIMRGKELVNQKGQIVDQENFNKALFSLMEERFKGGMEIQANSLKGLWSTVTGVAKTTLATMAGISGTGEIVAGGLFDTIKNGIKGVVDQLNQWQQSGQLQAWAAQSQAAFSAFLGVASDVFNGLIAVGKWIIDNWGLIGPILAGVLAGFMAYQTAIAVINAVKIAQAALNLVMTANPIALITLAIAALVAAGVYLYEHWGEVKAKAAEIWENIKTTIVNAATAVGEFLKQLIYAVVQNWDAIKAKTIEIWNAVKDFVVGAFQWMYDHNYYFQAIVDFIRNAWETIKNFSSDIWNGIKEALTTIWDTIKGAIEEKWNAISLVTSTIWSVISDFLSGIWNQIKIQTTTAWNVIFGVINGVWEKIKEGFGSLVDTAWNWGKNLMDNFIKGLKSMFTSLWESMSNVADTVSGFLGFHSPTKLGPGRDADKWAPSLIEMYAKGIQNALPDLRSSLGEMAFALSPTSLMVAPSVAAAGGGNTLPSMTVNIYGNNTDEIWTKFERKFKLMGYKGRL